MAKTSVMLVDDHPLFRQGLRRVIETEDDLEVIMEVADGEEALRLAKQLTPDVVLSLPEPASPQRGNRP